MAIGQGAFYLASGLWPLFDLESFEKVTGPKTDDWLVKTVGLLLATTGVVLLDAGFRAWTEDDLPGELVAIAGGEALVLGGVSSFYSLVGRISKIYLADAAVELALALAWRAASPARGRSVEASARHGNRRVA
ncbi:MAG: hypothetical protein HY075_05990 [Deltaproteobacteria bacterium]|nr:hypothetical protein [Deltaproteobacteria bacterium]